MRTDGFVTTIPAEDPPDHVCWMYDDAGGPDPALDDVSITGAAA